MDDPKPWYASKGVIGPLVAAVCAILTAAGVTLKAPPQDVTDALVTLLPVLVGGVAAMVGMIGRLTATKRIGGVPPPNVAEMRAITAHVSAEEAERVVVEHPSDDRQVVAQAAGDAVRRLAA